MAEVLASLKKIGGSGEQYTETVLWTNPSPAEIFDAQTVTLSDSISNYKYIAFKYKYGNTTADTDYALEIFPIEDIRGSVADSNNRDIVSLGIITATAQLWSRAVYYVSDTSLQFSLCYRLNASGSTRNGANPIEILGINELAHTPVKGEIVYLGQGYSANTSALSITLNDSLSNYAYIAITLSDVTATDYIPTTAATYPIQIMANVEYFKHNNMQGYFVTGSSGGATYQTATYSYVDDTHITAQKTVATNRTYYVYGIK